MKTLFISNVVFLYVKMKREYIETKMNIPSEYIQKILDDIDKDMIFFQQV